jgi:vacuolar-type H+-ATPase subunit I/STV1
MVSKHGVKIAQTETEFLLSIHASQKERAKTIPGYRWDTVRKYWVYPKTAKSYDALIDEFGDDLIGDLILTRPSNSEQAKTEDLQVENQGLKEEIAKIHKTLELISGTASDGRISETQALQSALAAKESELAEIRHRTQDLERQLEEKRSVSRDYFKEVERLRAANQKLQLELDKQSNQGSRVDRQQWIREIVKAATGDNEKFCLIADQVWFDATLPI